MNSIKSLVKTVLVSAGLNVSKHGLGLKNSASPVELRPEETEFLKYLIKNRLTMVSQERMWATMFACKYVVEQNILGDFVECGVWRGGNALIAASIFKWYGSDKRVFLFDTFKGMTEPDENDVAIKNGQPAMKKYVENKKDDRSEWCYASIQDVRKNFSDLGLLNDNVVFVEGDVCETLANKNNLPSEISVLRLDTDWYESTKAELEILYPRLSVGGTIIIDDYGHWSGARKATEEYFAKYGPRPLLNYTDHTGRIGVKFVH
jgi:O-methyltransferase